MSECPGIGQIEDYRAGELAGEGAERLAAHIESCPSCQDQIVELKRLDVLGDKLRSVAPTEGGSEIPGYSAGGELHRGGQGVVLRAKQDSTGRDVAIKVLLHGRLASRKERARFEREVETAARVRHPNVVPIIDRGATADGRAFYAMELVDGLTLDRYVAEAEPGTRERLRLFAAVCDGIAAAHRHGVLHRDIKPQNIVVADGPTPMVLDFGLARDQDNAARHTMTGEFMGTLAYASPEQVSGDPDAIDARTDVYSLGVVLYELLTGRLPYRVDGPLDEAVRNVAETDAPRPGSVVRGVNADLDVIVRHAMEKDPARRYQSVDTLAEDVRRCLDDLPILARRQSTRYQLGKFARRHKTAVGVSATLAVGLVATLIAVTVGLVRTNAAAQRAEDELAKQQAINGFFRSLLAQVDPGQSGADMRVTELLDVASGRVEDGFADFPELRGQLQRTLGETYGRLGAYDQAEAQLVAAIDAMESLEEPPTGEYASTVGSLGLILTYMTRLDEAGDRLAEAADLAEAAGLTHALARIRHDQGALEDTRGDYEQAVAYYEQAIELVSGDESDAARRLLGQSLIGIGVAAKMLERYDEALGYYDRALGLLSELRAENHPDILAIINNRIEVLSKLGRNEEALALQRDLLTRRIDTFGPTHERVGITFNNLADLLREMGRYKEASGYFDQAAAIFRENPGDPSLRLAVTLYNAGVMSLEQRDDAVALQRLSESAEMAAGLLPETNWFGAQIRVRLAEAIANDRRVEEAIPMIEQARAVMAAGLGEDHRRVRAADDLLARLTSEQ